MSYASVHFVLYKDGKFWNGKLPPDCWGPLYGREGAVRLYGGEDACKVLNGVFNSDPSITLVEDE